MMIVIHSYIFNISRPLVDVKKGEYILKINEEQIVFKMFNHEAFLPKTNFNPKVDDLDACNGESVHVGYITDT